MTSGGVVTERLVQQRKARSTGTIVVVVHGLLDLGSPELTWWTICEDHGGLVGHMTRADAVGWAPAPEAWCPTCQEPEPTRETP